MPAEQQERQFKRSLSALADPYRRQLLLALLDHNPQDDDDRDPLNIVEGDEEPEVLETETRRHGIHHVGPNRKDNQSRAEVGANRPATRTPPRESR